MKCLLEVSLIKYLLFNYPGFISIQFLFFNMLIGVQILNWLCILGVISQSWWIIFFYMLSVLICKDILFLSPSFLPFLITREWTQELTHARQVVNNSQLHLLRFSWELKIFSWGLWVCIFFLMYLSSFYIRALLALFKITFSSLYFKNISLNKKLISKLPENTIKIIRGWAFICEVFN